MTRFRIVERFRLFWLSKDLTPFRVPKPAVGSTEIIQESNDGSSVRLLLSPNSAATAHLHASLLTITPGRELPSYRARAVEFYYVISGNGSFSQQGVVETNSIAAGDCFVVDSGNMRWISNSKKAVTDLVLLRVTDGGLQYNRLHPADKIRRDPNHKSVSSRSSMELIASGLRTVQAKARDYYSNSSSSDKENKPTNASATAKKKITSSGMSTQWNMTQEQDKQMCSAMSE